jgi:hypothetical protein
MEGEESCLVDRQPRLVEITGIGGFDDDAPHVWWLLAGCLT